MQIHVEGWRFIPYSYSITHQFQLLEMLRRSSLKITHQEMPGLKPEWQTFTGFLTPELETQLQQIPSAINPAVDVTLRVYQPFNFNSSNSRKTLIYATAPWGILIDSSSPLKPLFHLKNQTINPDITIITPSQWSREGLIRSGLNPQQIKVVPWGVDPSIYYPLNKTEKIQLRKQWGWEDYFIFLSESCIPLYNIDEFFRRLQGQIKSWIDYNNKPTNGYAYSNQFAPLKDVVPDICVYKSDQWVMLNRINAIQLMDFEKQTNISIWNLMSNIVKASDEMWIPTILCIINNGLENVVEKRKITYVDWGQETRSPITFEEITPELVQRARENGCLFMRKFKARNPMWLVDDWHKNIL